MRWDITVECRFFNNAAPVSIPDHSVIAWKINVMSMVTKSPATHDDAPEGSHFDKFDLTAATDSFLSAPGILQKINTAIVSLEGSFRTQTDIDIVYDNWCSIIRDQMYTELPYKRIQVGVSNKKRRFSKPWWNIQLTDMWNNVCEYERRWLRCNVKTERSRFKVDYVNCRKSFDRAVQRTKRVYWYNLQKQLTQECNEGTNEFWKTIGRVGLGQSKSRKIPMEVVLEDGTISRDCKDVLEKWKHEFCSLLNAKPNDAQQTTNTFANVMPAERLDPLFYEHISLFEVTKAICDAKKGKACGFDSIPVEVLCNDASVSFLHVLFNVCFDKGMVPSSWGKCIINPIPKSSTADPRDPLSYRGISLASAMYKLYCSILNNRISSWSESNGKLVDEQNGFRKARSTIDHVSTLTNIIETRKKKKLSTFCAFIDFRKAYDCIDRDLLWNKLGSIGIGGKLLTAVRSLYASVTSCVRVNNLTTDWFDVTCGLRQGCCLSPLLFNLFINDLALRIKSLGKGVPVDDELLSILLYADDIVLVAENASDLQLMLDCLNEWCGHNSMSINASKSNVIHFRPNATQKSNHDFRCGIYNLLIADKYTYLGITLNEYLDYSLTAKAVAQSASRALGLLIAKFKCMGGMPYDVFTRLYDSLVWPVISYGASIWGTKSFSCIAAVQNRAMRFFLGTGKYTPNAAVCGDMGWEPTHIKQWKSVCLYWHRMVHLDGSRINKRVFCWSDRNAGRGCKNHNFLVKEKFKKAGLESFCNIRENFSRNALISQVIEATKTEFVDDWFNTVNSESGRSGNGRNKLRTYRLFKSEFKVETYCKLLMPYSHRSAFARFRCGVAPIRLETGRYEHLAVEQRLCHFCNVVEDEPHVILEYSHYEDLRRVLFSRAAVILPNFNDLNANEKISFLFSNPDMIRICAKTCFKILQKRNATFYR